jgi:hypothetical protein
MVGTSVAQAQGTTPSTSSQTNPLRLTRATTTTGLNDSVVVLVCDSVRPGCRARGMSLALMRKYVAIRGLDSVVTTKLNLTGGTVTGSPTWASAQTFAASQRVDSATGAARSQILTTARTLWGVSFDGSANITAAPTFSAGATISSGQTLTVSGATITGLTAASVGSGAFPSGTYSFTGATALTGGAGNWTQTAGTGASRTMTLQTTNVSSAAINTLILGADSSVTPLGKFVPNSTKGIVGTTTNDAANAGSIGEIITGARATGSSLSLTSPNALTVDSISLTAGDWDVSGVVAFTPAATTSITFLNGGISTTTNTIGALGTYFAWSTAANIPTAVDEAWITPTVQISVASTTTVFLIAKATFSASTLKGYGSMRARRVR